MLFSSLTMDIALNLTKELCQQSWYRQTNSRLQYNWSQAPLLWIDRGIDMQHTTTIGGTKIVSKSLCFVDDLDILSLYLSLWQTASVFANPPHRWCGTTFDGWYHKDK
jgi:hypothetical protein